jgi:UDP-N-acetylmuramate dehydrogenase
VAELLADHTTLRLGGPAHSFVEAIREETLIEAVRAADEATIRVLILAGGSNMVVADTGFPGVVIKVATRGLGQQTSSNSSEGVRVRVASGESWDDFVALAVEHGWAGIEALSGIPGTVGSTPIQNVGAYGQEVAESIASVRVWDRAEERIRTIAAADCAFGYRRSRFKVDPHRFIVLTVDFQLKVGELGAPVKYAELARALGVSLGAQAPLVEVRRMVLALRATKGMVLDSADYDTWSAGSFFTNPIVRPEQAVGLPIESPRWAQFDGSIKTSAAWLIEHAGFAKGYGLKIKGGRVSLSTKHPLALTNRGGATTIELLSLAREVREGVHRDFGIRLVNEPVLVGCDLD